LRVHTLHTANIKLFSTKYMVVKAVLNSVRGDKETLFCTLAHSYVRMSTAARNYPICTDSIIQGVNWLFEDLNPKPDRTSYARSIVSSKNHT
jgi:hypothetical protein